MRKLVDDQGGLADEENERHSTETNTGNGRNDTVLSDGGGCRGIKRQRV